jgi:hypothetical protein
MVYKLNIRKCIYQLVEQRKKYEIYELFKDINISKSTIYQTIRYCENDFPCIMKLNSTRCWQQKSAKCVAEHQKPRESVIMACDQEKQHHFFLQFIVFFEKTTHYYRFLFFSDIFVTKNQKVIVMEVFHIFTQHLDRKKWFVDTWC